MWESSKEEESENILYFCKFLEIAHCIIAMRT